MKIRTLAIVLAVTAAVLPGCGEKKKKQPELAAETGAYSLLGFDPGAEHDANEPDTFDATWAGREAEEVMKRAKSQAFENRSASAHGESCVAFFEGPTVRRLLMGSGRPGEPTAEVTFSNTGTLVLYFHSDRQQPATYQWAYYHRGARLARYSHKSGSAQMVTTAVPASMPGQIAMRTNGCLDALSASNARVGAAPGVAPPPQPQRAPAPAAVGPGVARVKIRPGEAFEVTFGRPMTAPAGQQYWLTATRPAEPDSAWGTWHYVGANATTDRVSVKGTGEFELRLHDLYPKNSSRVIWRQRVFVDETAVFNPGAASQAKSIPACCPRGELIHGVPPGDACPSGYIKQTETDCACWCMHHD